jgi:hypothetical protein
MIDDSPEAIAARYAEQGRHNLAVHARAKVGRPAAGPEPCSKSASARITPSASAKIDDLAECWGVKRGTAIRRVLTAGLAAIETPE